MKTAVLGFALTLGASLLAVEVVAADPPGEGPRLGTDRMTQEQVTSGRLDLTDLRVAGLRMFVTPFNRLDGYGDGPMNPADPISPGGRPTLQGNGTFLRVNGLDAQTCLECHTQISAATMPPTLGIGGVGGSNANAIIMPSAMDPGDFFDSDGKALMNGRFANPPFLFGAGGVEMVGLEMTIDLQALKQHALDNPGTVVPLVTKGVDFGTIAADAAGNLDTSGVVGIGPDLIVRPFGRKGEFATTRDFDIGAMQFHFGMQPVEVVGRDVDADGDGVVNEVLPGELSALQIFVLTVERCRQEKLTDEARRGFETFQRIGCTECHIPSLPTRSRMLPLRFPAVPTDPYANVYYWIDLSKPEPGFDKNRQGGVDVPLFADLKHHDMGPGLAEDFALADAKTNREFTTARLWGIADTAPYLHDGRATTLSDAILMHGGEALEEANEFGALTGVEREELLAFLRSLRTPEKPLEALARKLDKTDTRRDRASRR